MLKDLSLKIAAKDVSGRGLSKNDFSDKAMYGAARNATKSPGKIFVYLADSLGVGAGSTGGLSYFNISKRVAGSAVISEASINASVAGETSAQILARYDAQVRNRVDGVVVDGVIVAAGTNDLIQNVPLSTFAANIRAFHRKAIEDNITIILGTVPPLGTNTGQAVSSTPENRALLLQYNTYIRMYCAKYNIPFAETNGALTVKTGASAGAIDPLYMPVGTDNVHYNNYGHVAQGKLIGNILSGLFTAPHLVDHISGASSNIGANLIANPTFAVDASSWQEQSGATGNAATYSVVNDTTGKLKSGRWYQAEWTCTTAGQKNVRSSSITFATYGIVAGDKLLITARCDYEDLEGNYEFNATPASKPCQLGLYVMDSGFGQRAILDDGAVGKPGPVAAIFTVPAGMTGLIISMFVKLNVGRSVRFKIGEVGVFKVTGLDDIIALI